MKFNLFLVNLNQEVNIFYDRTNCDGGGGGGDTRCCNIICFELFTLTGGGDTKTLFFHPLMPKSHLVKLSQH